jgi:hypothetical protein
VTEVTEVTGSSDKNWVGGGERSSAGARLWQSGNVLNVMEEVEVTGDGSSGGRDGIVGWIACFERGSDRSDSL